MAGLLYCWRAKRVFCPQSIIFGVAHIRRAAARLPLYGHGVIYSSALCGRINHKLKFTTPINKIRSVSSCDAPRAKTNFCAGVGSFFVLHPSHSLACSAPAARAKFAQRTCDCAALPTRRSASERPGIVIKCSTYCP
jgi:hypothetical protein